MNYPACGVFRRDGKWVIAFGNTKGDTLASELDISCDDEGFRAFHRLLEEHIEQNRGNPPGIVRLQVFPNVLVSWTWEGFQDVFRLVSARVKQLDLGKPIPDSDHVSWD